MNSITLDINDLLKVSLFIRFLAESKKPVTITAEKLNFTKTKFNLENINSKDIEGFNALLDIL